MNQIKIKSPTLHARTTWSRNDSKKQSRLSRSKQNGMSLQCVKFKKIFKMVHGQIPKKWGKNPLTDGKSLGLTRF